MRINCLHDVSGLFVSLFWIGHFHVQHRKACVQCEHRTGIEQTEVMNESWRPLVYCAAEQIKARSFSQREGEEAKTFIDSLQFSWILYCSRWETYESTEEFYLENPHGLSCHAGNKNLYSTLWDTGSWFCSPTVLHFNARVDNNEHVATCKESKGGSEQIKHL